jgi:non-specific serine/threonine protein kinase
LGEEGAAELQRLVERCKHAARAALALRPAGYDGEVVYLLTLLQSLGRLVVHYHFAEEAQQIRRLMQPAPPSRAGEAEEPGMTEEGASYAVIGADVESIGAAVARWWGLDEGVLAMIRRLPLATPVRGIESDDEILRAVASCANEAVDALALPEPKQTAALQRVVQRYGRVLDIGLRELRAVVQEPGTRTEPANAEATREATVQAPVQARVQAPLQVPAQTPVQASVQEPEPSTSHAPARPGGLRAAAASLAAAESR